MSELCTFSRLDQDQLMAVQHLEKDLGKRLLAYSGHDVELAALSSEEVRKINGLQRELGIVLVAVK
jgi:hypothetical protein